MVILIFKLIFLLVTNFCQFQKRVGGGDFKWFFPTKNQILSNLKLILILKDLNNFATL
jgi:hypothetical protein